MVKNYLKSAIRNFLKHKTFTLLNILGLSIGLAASVLILQFVKYERSFDTFHSHIDNLYRIQYNVIQNGIKTVECAAAVPAVGPEMKETFPEILEFTRLFPVSGIMSYDSPDRGFISFREEKMQITDSRVFSVFDFELVEGTEAEALNGPDKAVISQRAAKKYFLDENPLGKRISWASWQGEKEFEITAVMKDIPDNSHIKFDILLSQETLNNMTDNQSETNWGWYDFNTYVLLEDGVDHTELQKKWDSHLAELKAEEWGNRNSKQEFIFQPVRDIHLYSNLLQESQPEEQGDGDSVYFLTIIAFFILIIAWVNYVNLSTAKSFERANEVGVRKVMGAQKGQLIRQFFAESFLINLLATAIAVVLIRLGWSSFADLSGRNIPLSYIIGIDFWFLVIGLFVIGTALSGFYPALVLSSFKPVAVLKSKAVSTKGGALMRKALVVFQFVASIVLICGTGVVYQQLSFMQNQDLGIDIEHTLVLEGPGIVNDSLYDSDLESFRNETRKIAGVSSFSASTNVPGDEIYWTRGIRRIQGGPESSITVYNVGIDPEYIPTFGLELLAGRNFSRDFTNDNERVILNKALADALEYDTPEDAVGQEVRLGGDTLEVAGVIDNFHQMSLKDKVRPLVFRQVSGNSFFAVKVENGNYQEVLSAIDEPWKAIFPGNPIDYFYLDSFFNRQYDKDRKFGQVFGLFSMLAIIVASLGLFGLASFMTIQRTKEIGIRKVLGSNVPNIVILLSRGFIQLVLIANLIAWPLAWFVMDNWLATFPYRIAMSPWLFITAGVLVVSIAFVSVSFQTLKAATLDPAKTLKYE